MMNMIIPVTFHQDTLALIEHNGEPYVPMKPIVENMGLAWSPQRSKLNEKFGSTVTIIVSVGGDGKQRDMLCLPMRKITGWLNTINPNKVKPELRDKIIQYQDECDDVLWQYWTKGYVGKAAQKPPTYNQQIAASKERSRLVKELQRQHQKEVRESIYQQIIHVSQIMGIDPPEMENIRPVAKRLTPWEEQQKWEAQQPIKRSTLPPELVGLRDDDDWVECYGEDHE